MKKNSTRMHTIPGKHHRKTLVCIRPLQPVLAAIAMCCCAASSATASGRQPACPEMLSLKKCARRCKATLHSHANDTVTMESRFHTLALRNGTRRADFNDVIVWLAYPARQTWTNWKLAEPDMSHTIEPLFSPSLTLHHLDAVPVVLDPGHGGHDSGAVGTANGLQEKHAALSIAAKTAELLRNSGIPVFLTRENDSYLSLAARCDFARKKKARVFVSIHLNAAQRKGAEGIETHILPVTGCPPTGAPTTHKTDALPAPGNSFDNANMLLGYYVQSNLLKTTGALDRGLRRSNFHVLRNATCPAALAECGFVSNAAEENRILTSRYRSLAARGIALGILNYVRLARQSRILHSPE